jgi:phosphocarrier protein FPr/phosphocarrier protein
MAVDVGAPMRGVVFPLEDVPDAVFAQKVLGDGLAIEPLDPLVRAPIAGAVIGLAPTGHSVTLRHPDGVELLVHVGVDTVGLAGQGFRPLVALGAVVEAGAPLIECDLAAIAAAQRSPITAIVVLAPAQPIVNPAGPGPIAAGERLFSVAPAAGAEAQAAAEPAGDAVWHGVVELADGIHARPAALIARTAAAFRSRIVVEVGGARANAASVTALMALGATRGSPVEIRAEGPDAAEAAAAVAQSLSGDRGLSAEQSQASAEPAAVAGQARAASECAGVRASPGVAAGPAFVLRDADLAVDGPSAGADAERARLSHALQACAAAMASTPLTGEAAAIQEAHRALLDDHDLRSAAFAAIGGGANAGLAWRRACRDLAARLRGTGVARLAEREADLLDVERRVVAQLSGVDARPVLPPKDCIVLADELLPSTVIAWPTGLVAGVCTARGGATSHAAILAASKGIPMVVRAGERILTARDGDLVLLDADRGVIDLAPTPQALEHAAGQRRAQAVQRALAHDQAHEPCRLADGVRIEVFANVASVEDAREAARLGAEGCGLLRSEFLFFDRQAPPDETEQAAFYAEVAEALAPGPVIFRTLDAGADKPLAYLPGPPEDNPALGLRGVRLSLQRPDLLETQLRAMVRAAPAERLRVMLPMVVEAEEVLAVRGLLDRVVADMNIGAPVQLGIMIETPAAAVLADSLARHVDFMSVGSNDLTQYALAMDRGHAGLAARADGFHPAVLRLIRQAAQGAQASGRWFGVCGGLASDPAAAPLLVGLGCRELSASPGAVPLIKHRLRRVSLASCEALAARALAAESAGAVRALVEQEPGG